MKLIPVVELTKEQYDMYSVIATHLNDALNNQPHLGLDYVKCPQRYACAVYSGVVKQETIEALGRMPTELEVSMMCDKGFSHFGGSCVVDEKTGRFDCTIYVD